MIRLIDLISSPSKETRTFHSSFAIPLLRNAKWSYSTQTTSSNNAQKCWIYITYLPKTTSFFPWTGHDPLLHDINVLFLELRPFLVAYTSRYTRKQKKSFLLFVLLSPYLPDPSLDLPFPNLHTCSEIYTFMK